MKIFVAGASGAIGRRLLPMLIDAGHRVVGMTRSSGSANWLDHLGAQAVIADVFDAPAVHCAVGAAEPDVIIHQLTDLGGPGDFASAVERNARIRKRGTLNLILAAKDARVGRFIAQSIGWAYAPAATPYREDLPLETNAVGARAVTIGGVVALEDAVLEQRNMHPIVLRYGKLYGPGTGVDQPDPHMALHVDAAALAALLAVKHGASGVYNVAEGSSVISSAKAARELGWRSDFRLTKSRG